MTVKELTAGLFQRYSCPVRKAKQDRGHDWAQSTMSVYKYILDKWVLSEMGDKELTSITYLYLESYITALLESGTVSKSYAQNIIKVIKIVFQHACDLHLIPNNIAEPLLPIKAEPAEKDYLTDSEISLLFNDNNNWPNFKHKIINVIACYTGMYMGEILALGYENYFYEDDCSFLIVDHNWDPVSGYTKTRNRRRRIVPIPDWLVEELKKLDFESKFWFMSPRKNSVMSKNYAKDGFYRALSKIGIDEKQRKLRNITFGSWRNRYIARLSKSFSAEELRVIVGFRMDNKYIDEFNKIQDITKQAINTEILK